MKLQKPDFTIFRPTIGLCLFGKIQFADDVQYLFIDHITYSYYSFIFLIVVFYSNAQRPHKARHSYKNIEQ